MIRISFFSYNEYGGGINRVFKNLNLMVVVEWFVRKAASRASRTATAVVVSVDAAQLGNHNPQQTPNGCYDRS